MKKKDNFLMGISLRGNDHARIGNSCQLLPDPPYSDLKEISEVIHTPASLLEPISEYLV